MRRTLLLLLLLPLQVVANPDPASADCVVSTTLTIGDATCHKSSSEVRDLWASSAVDGVRYRLQQACAVGVAEPGGCFNPRVCSERPGGLVYFLLSQPLGGGPWTTVGTVCLNSEDAAGLGVITPGLVQREFERLDWPSAPVVVEPPGGETLVNFETNFFTTLTDPESQTVGLLGQRVLIEATPVSYRWHFGDGSSVSTSSPGRAFPHLVHTHRYGLPGRVRVSVDVTYRGRYRVNGGEWIAIPATRVIPGVAVGLRVIEAVPQLSAAQ